MVGKRLLLTVLAAAALAVVLPRPCYAIPAWSRKYEVSCALCHRPAPPRLNVFGHQFRKHGFRTPDEIGQKPKYTEIGDYVSVRQRVRYRNLDDDPGESRSEIRFNDMTFFYAGPVTDHLTIFTELEWEDIEELLLNGYISWFSGTPDKWHSWRAGQMHTLQRVGWGGWDRQTGIDAPLIYGQALVRSSTAATGIAGLSLRGSDVRINRDQRGIEFAYGPNMNSRFILQVLDGFNPELPSGDGFASPFGERGEGGGDFDSDKDFLGAYEVILDPNGSGLTLMGYKGTFHRIARSAGTVIEDLSLTEFDFTRWFLTGSYVFNSPLVRGQLGEVQAGFAWANDDFPSANKPAGRDDVSGTGFYLDLEQYLPHDAGVFLRYDNIDPDTEAVGDIRDRWTIGAVYDVNDNLRLALEAFTEKVRQTNTESNQIQLEAMINF